MICQRNSFHLYDIAYLLIRSHEDVDLLQEDLVILAEWEEQRRMKFYSSKCTKMKVTSKREPILSDYYLHGHIIANEPLAKYLGFTLTQDLNWDTHIQNICVKAIQTIGFLRRNLNIGTVSIKQQAYFSLIHLLFMFAPLVEYSSTVWDSYTQKKFKKLEMVQRSAARYVLHRYHNTASVTNMFKTLNLRSLENRKKGMHPCMIFN